MVEAIADRSFDTPFDKLRTERVWVAMADVGLTRWWGSAGQRESGHGRVQDDRPCPAVSRSVHRYPVRKASSWKTPLWSAPMPSSGRKLAIVLPSIAATPLLATSRQLAEEILPVVKKR